MVLEYVKTSADNLYNHERYSIYSVQAKVGLMFVSDLYYSYASDGLDSSNTNCNKDHCWESWLALQNKGVSFENDYGEWTMTRTYEGLAAFFYDWAVSSSSAPVSSQLNAQYSVRPVFYLSADTLISFGSGTSADPFIIEKTQLEKGNS